MSVWSKPNVTLLPVVVCYFRVVFDGDNSVYSQCTHTRLPRGQYMRCLFKLFRRLRPGLERFVASMLEGECKQKVLIPRLLGLLLF